MSDVDRIPMSADGFSGPSDSPRVTRTGGAWRALVAGAITAIMLVAMLGVAVFAQSGRTADGPTFLPADSVLYAELRLDLPGDQREALMAFLGHLPGFADGAAFDTKLDETVDQLLGGSDSPISWTEDIKPWFGGQVMAGLTGLPSMDMSAGATAAAESAPFIIGLSSTDEVALDAAVTKALGSMGASVTTEEHAGSTISTVTQADGSTTVIAPTETVLLIANGSSQIETSLDVLAGTAPSLAADADYQAAEATLPADRLGAFYLDTAQLKESLGPLLTQQLQAQPEMAATADQIEAVLAMLPPWVTGVIRVDADHLTVRFDAPVVEGGVTVAVRATDLAARMPADTMLYVEMRDLGGALKTIIGQLKPALVAQGNDKALKQVEALLGTNLEDYLDWVQDVAIGASVGAAGPSVGLVATLTDQATGEERLDTLLTLIRAISATADPSPVELSQSDVNGVTVTTIALTEAAGVDADLPVDARVSVAISDGHLYLGLGDFAAQAVARDAADSLAATPGFTKASAAIGGEHAGMVYVDVASALDIVETMLPAGDQEMYQNQIKPYAEALDFVVASLDQDASTSSASLMLFVK